MTRRTHNVDLTCALDWTPDPPTSCKVCNVMLRMRIVVELYEHHSLCTTKHVVHKILELMLDYLCCDRTS